MRAIHWPRGVESLGICLNAIEMSWGYIIELGGSSINAIFGVNGPSLIFGTSAARIVS